MCKFCDVRPDNEFAEGYVYNGDSASYWNIGDKVSYFCLDNSGALFHFRGDGRDWGFFDILYCPMCGRKIDRTELRKVYEMNDNHFPTDEEIFNMIK